VDFQEDKKAELLEKINKMKKKIKDSK